MKFLLSLLPLALLVSCSNGPEDTDFASVVEKDERIKDLYEISIDDKKEIRREERNSILCIQYEIDCSLKAKEDLMVANEKEPWGTVSFRIPGMYKRMSAPTAVKKGEGNEQLYKKIVKKGAEFSLKEKKMTLCTNLKESPQRWRTMF